MQNFIEQKVKEYKEAYRGLLLPDTIDGGVEWYRSSFREVALRAVEEVKKGMPKQDMSQSVEVLKKLNTNESLLNFESVELAQKQSQEVGYNQALSDTLFTLTKLSEEIEKI